MALSDEAKEWITKFLERQSVFNRDEYEELFSEGGIQKSYKIMLESLRLTSGISKLGGVTLIGLPNALKERNSSIRVELTFNKTETIQFIRTKLGEMS